MPNFHQDPKYALRKALECARMGHKPSRYIMETMSRGDRLDYEQAKRAYDERNDALRVDHLRKSALKILAYRDAESELLTSSADLGQHNPSSLNASDLVAEAFSDLDAYLGRYDDGQ